MDHTHCLIDMGLHLVIKQLAVSMVVVAVDSSTCVHLLTMVDLYCYLVLSSSQSCIKRNVWLLCAAGGDRVCMFSISNNQDETVAG